MISSHLPVATLPFCQNAAAKRVAVLVCAVMATLLASLPAAAQGEDWRDGYDAARASAHAAYELAAMAFDGDTTRSGHIRALTVAAHYSADQAKEQSHDSAVDRALQALKGNLSRLEMAFSLGALNVEIDTTRQDPPRTEILGELRLRQRPISYEAVRSTLMALERAQRLNQRGTFVLYLHTEFRAIIDELDQLSALPEWRPGLTAGVFEENLVSLGMGAAVGDVVVMPSVLLTAAGELDWAGLELAAGFRSGYLVIVPGVVFLRDGEWRAGPSLTVLMVRPNWLSIGVSVSELQGFGIRTVVDPRNLRRRSGPAPR